MNDAALINRLNNLAMECVKKHGSHAWEKMAEQVKKEPDLVSFFLDPYLDEAKKKLDKTAGHTT